jgi:plastocyanin
MRRPFLLLAASLLLLAAACGDDDSGGSSDTTAGSPPPVSLEGKVNDHGTKDLGTATELELEADDFYFGPTYIKAAPGSTVKVNLTNEGSSKHTFTIDGTDINQELEPEATATVDVTVPASGGLSFYCRFHRSQGMQGSFFTS